MNDLDSVKALCRSVLMTCSYGVVGSQFPKEYEDTTGMVFPLKSLGIRSIMELPKIMPDVIKAERNAQGQIMFYVVADEKTAHIAKMKRKEKTKSKKGRRTGPKMILIGTESSKPPVRPKAYVPPPRLNHTNRPVSYQKPVSRPVSRPTATPYRPAAAPYKPAAAPYKPAAAPFKSVAATPKPVAAPTNKPSEQICRAIPAELLCSKIRTLMSEFNQGLWSGKLVDEYESYFKEKVQGDLVDLVQQMEGNVVRIERPYGMNSKKFILYGIENSVEHSPRANGNHVTTTTKTTTATTPRTTMKYPYTYRYVHSPLPWLGVRFECYVTFSESPSKFWVQIKSEQLDDLVKITELIQTQCDAADPEPHGKFYVNELVCGLFPDDNKWYRAIVLDVGEERGFSCLESLDPALFLPNKPVPQLRWENHWSVKVFFVDYGNIAWLPLLNIRRKKFPYPNGQAFQCRLGSITPNAEWSRDIKELFRNITEVRDAEHLRLTVEAVKSTKAHYGFKSRLNEYCQKRKLDTATFAKPLNSVNGWRTSCQIRHPTKGMMSYTGFFQLKKNDAEASAAQHVIRDWEIELLQSHEMPDHWIDVILENKETGEVYNKSLVESGVAIADTSIYNIEIPKQPDPRDIPQPKSELNYPSTITVISSDESESDEQCSSRDSTDEKVVSDPPLLQLPEVGSMVYMQVTHVQSPTNICMRNIDGDNDKILLNMEDDLTEWMKTKSQPLSPVKVDNLCVVFSDKIAYRARVLKLRKNDKVEVLMLDYGDTQIFGIQEIYQLDREFLSLPYQAISCCLSGLEKILNAEQITDYMRDNIEEQRFIVKVKAIVGERTLSVELWEDVEDGDKVNDILLAQDIRNLKPVLPMDGELHAVKVTDIASNGVISLQVEGPGLLSLDELMKQLRDYYENNAPRASDYVVDPNLGQMCCSSSLLGGERSWYRALINRKVDGHSVEVLFVDYGHSQVIAKSKLREPANAVPNISRLPFQMYKVRLADLPSGAEYWTNREIDTLKGYLSEQNDVRAEVVEAAKGECPTVRLYLSPHSGGEPRILNNLLSTDSNLFQQPLHAMEQLSLTRPRIEVKDVVKSQADIPRLSLRRECEAALSHIVSPDCWYFQCREYNSLFGDMSEDMNNFYSQPLDYNDTVYEDGDVCVAFCTHYQGWYRARIISQSNEGVQCSMLDYGDMQTIPHTSLRPLVKKFAVIPIQACRAALAGVSPSGGGDWTTDSLDFFSEAVSDKLLWVRIVEQDKLTSVLRMQLIDTSGEIDVYISNLMVAKGHAKQET